MIPEAEQRRAVALIGAAIAYQHTAPTRIPGRAPVDPRIAAKYVTDLATAFEAWIASAVTEPPPSGA